MAKVAAYFTLEKNKKVALMTADTYRIAAVEQLRTYSNIIDIPFAVCYQSTKLESMLNNQFSDCDLVLIDTPGSSWKNELQLEELREYTSHEFIDEVHLLLSLNTKSSDLYNIIDKFSPLEPDKIIFTKLDETTSYGDIINIKENYQLPFSYLTYGQDVPEDISTAEAENLFDYIFGDFYE
jgi:flagellar biosynthesis protein FlhF